MTESKSSRPLAVTALVLILGGLVLVVGPQGPSSEPSPRELTATRSATSSQPPSSPAPEEEPATEKLAQQLEAQRRAVAAFARTFTDDSLNHEAWLAALSRRVTPELLKGFAYTDPALRPTAPPTQVTYLAPGARFLLDFATGEQMVCSVILGPDDKWLINSVEPVHTVPTGNDV